MEIKVVCDNFKAGPHLSLLVDGVNRFLHLVQNTEEPKVRSVAINDDLPVPAVRITLELGIDMPFSGLQEKGEAEIDHVYERGVTRQTIDGHGQPFQGQVSGTTPEQIEQALLFVVREWVAERSHYLAERHNRAEDELRRIHE